MLYSHLPCSLACRLLLRSTVQVPLLHRLRPIKAVYHRETTNTQDLLGCLDWVSLINAKERLLMGLGCGLTVSFREAIHNEVLMSILLLRETPKNPPPSFNLLRLQDTESGRIIVLDGNYRLLKSLRHNVSTPVTMYTISGTGWQDHPLTSPFRKP